MWLRAWLFLLMAAHIPATTVAETGEAALLVRKFEQAYRSAATLRATFLERYLENGKEMRSEAGVAYFGKPGKMRWEYESPERNLFVIDGKWSWFYVPADHTATRIRAKESSDWRTPLALLAGEMKVSRVCGRVELERSRRPGDVHGVMLKCVLRGSQSRAETDNATAMYESAAESVAFEVNPESGELLRIVVFDPGGVEIEFRFARWEFNPPLDSGKFRFEPARGVAIVDGNLGVRGKEGKENEGHPHTEAAPSRAN